PGNSSGLSESQFSQRFPGRPPASWPHRCRQFALGGRHTCQPEERWRRRQSGPAAAALPFAGCASRNCSTNSAGAIWPSRRRRSGRRFNSAADRVLAERRKTLSVPNARALPTAGAHADQQRWPIHPVHAAAGSGSRTLLSNHQLQQQQQVLSYKPIEDFNLPDDDEYDVTWTMTLVTGVMPPKTARQFCYAAPAAQLGEDPAAGAVADALHIRLSTVAPSNQSARPPPPRSQLAMPSLRPRVHEDLLEAFGVQPEELAAAPVSQESISSEARVGRVNWESFSEA
uniref:INCENP_ARK-bind domain-containing protein n=1 Tax=Macrostomum lignano TaxID=282301 RepID=A0A1I8F752_9PLAT